MRFYEICLLGLICVAATFHSVSSVCCTVDCVVNSGDFLCDDCTQGTPYCGYGPCNIFGCNCDGGCRTGDCPNCGTLKTSTQRQNLTPKLPSSNSTATVDDIINQADQNNDGKMSIEEAKQWATLYHRGLNKAEMVAQISRLDADNNGYLSPNEIDK